MVVDKDRFETGNQDVVDGKRIRLLRRKTDWRSHSGIINSFKNQEWAKRINALLLEIESDPILSITIENIVIAIAAQVRQTKKKSAPIFQIIK